MTFLQGLRAAFFLELGVIKNSTYTLLLLSLVPLLAFAILMAIFKVGVPKDLSIAIVDKDHSSLSREISGALDASSTLKVYAVLNSAQEAKKLIQASKIYAYIILPEHFSRAVKTHTQPDISLFVNGQYILIAKMTSGAISRILMQFSAKERAGAQIVKAQNIERAIVSLQPVGMQINGFFNAFGNYFIFLISAILPALWQVFVVIVTLIAFGRIYKAKEEEKWIENASTPLRAVLGTLLPYSIIFFIQGMMIVSLLYFILPWPNAGSWWIISSALLLSTLDYQIIALLLFVVGFDYARSLSLGAVYTAPAFAFLGITFPLENMNSFATFWNDILPLSHYMQIQISQVNYGAPLQSIGNQFFALGLFLPLFLLVLLRFENYKRVGS